ncbi:hypothetical protein [Catenulispora sp. GAS73]|uniref:hypothetical protein n=1 Tax=Catenulispora sp. GAS73 TaxID=3156269 RepID=UPI0035110620
MSERAAPAYCPYCGDEDLRPEEGGHRRWSCRSCRRVFEVAFVGLLAPGAGRPAGADNAPHSAPHSGSGS